MRSTKRELKISIDLSERINKKLGFNCIHSRETEMIAKVLSNYKIELAKVAENYYTNDMESIEEYNP